MTQLPAKKKSVSVQDVAKSAGVSLGTVSRVINRCPEVASGIRRRVLVASRQVGFVPKTRHKCIAAVLGSKSPFSPIGYINVVISFLAQYLASFGYKLELIDQHNVQDAYEAHIDGVLGLVFDGSILEVEKMPNLPVMTFNCPLREYGIHSVAFDHYRQGIIGTEYVIKMGHSRIGFIENEDSNWASRERLNGYKKVLNENSIPFDAEKLGYARSQQLYDIIARFRKKGITVILNFGEDVSLEIFHLLKNVFQMHIPDDISLVTAETLPIFRYLSPPQTIIRQPFDELARIGAEKIVSLCIDASGGEILDIKLQSEIVIGDSVKQITPDG